MSIPIHYFKYLKNVESYQYFKVDPHNEIFLAKVSDINEGNGKITLTLEDSNVSITKNVNQIIEIIVK